MILQFFEKAFFPVEKAFFPVEKAFFFLSVFSIFGTRGALLSCH